MIKRIALLTLLAVAAMPLAFAGRLVLTLDSPVQSGAPGDFLTYTGQLTYESTDANDPLLFLNGESLSSPSEHLLSFPFVVAVNSNGFLTPGESMSNVSLSVLIDSDFGTNGTDVFGLNPFDYTLYGGPGWQDFGMLIDGSADGAHLFFVNVVDPNAPPPGDPPGEPPVDPPLTDPNAASVPEPATWMLVAGALSLARFLSRQAVSKARPR